MSLFSFLGLGDTKSDAITTFLEKGAIIIDVRTVNEFRSGHAINSKNIPLGELNSRIPEIKSLKKPIIVCCQSGMRSMQAAQVLKNENIDVINGGTWKTVEKHLS